MSPPLSCIFTTHIQGQHKSVCVKQGCLIMPQYNLFYAESRSITHPRGCVQNTVFKVFNTQVYLFLRCLKKNQLTLFSNDETKWFSTVKLPCLENKKTQRTLRGPSLVNCPHTPLSYRHQYISKQCIGLHKPLFRLISNMYRL